MQQRDERRLHDYLDGRLSEDDRAAFEAQLGDDAELRERVEESNRIGAALREGDEELSPGFYTRARARFEQTRRPGRGRFRIVSWEAAGLVAAASLAVAVFLPQLAQREQTGPAPELRQIAGEAAKTPSADSAATAGPDVPPEPAPPGKKIEAERQAPRDADDDAFRPRRAGASDAPAPPVPATAPKESGAVAGRSDKMAEQRLESEEWAPDPPAARPLPRSAPLAARAGSEESLADRETAGARGRAATSTVIALPPGIVRAGTIRTIENEAEWSELLKGPAGSALFPLGPPRAQARLVLIGNPGRGIDCRSVEARREGEAWIVGHDGGSPGDDGTGGCALVLPRDGRSVRLE